MFVLVFSCVFKLRTKDRVIFVWRLYTDSSTLSSVFVFVKYPQYRQKFRLCFFHLDYCSVLKRRYSRDSSSIKVIQPDSVRGRFFKIDSFTGLQVMYHPNYGFLYGHMTEVHVVIRLIQDLSRWTQYDLDLLVS